MEVGVGYNVQLAVDVKHKLIAEQDVSNNVLDIGLLAPTVEAAMQLLGADQIAAVAGRGYIQGRRHRSLRVGRQDQSVHQQ
ncbi:hypothetical protein [Rhizobium grahamii]|uniref:Uncharacterized protein n=1 Tax=Rhizobium grahamii TaxID=1120045 RepID=A0A370KDZ3_9HYPH|nr:hypothetical protein [Rhizobium grahamii]RDJ01475.1 hypothetical protein B5K06_34220 [Rhizobium grahamii]